MLQMHLHGVLQRAQIAQVVLQNGYLLRMRHVAEVEQFDSEKLRRIDGVFALLLHHAMKTLEGMTLPTREGMGKWEG